MLMKDLLPAEKQKYQNKEFYKMKAKVNTELCTGCGPCEYICPEVFKIVNDKAVVIVDVVPKNAEETAKQAAAECHVAAITLS